ncbi:MAG: putative cysteine desulfurase [Chlamydiales bacterium]|jgi:cysteine desulfurase/selenocysteine lyase|nr:putative cysteine desulfurase [Chlamydiales bacterium]
MALDMQQIRKDFPIFRRQVHGRPLLYLDSAATAHKPQVVIDTMREFLEEHYGTVHRAVYQLASESTNRYQQARSQVRAFLGAAHDEEIIFTKGCTESINLVASSFGKAFLKPGDEIAITDLEHHANIVPWQMIAKERGARLVVIPTSIEGNLSLETYRQHLSERTKLVSFCHIANSIGAVLPIEEMITIAHEKNAKVLVDGAQSAPHQKIDVQSLGADFFVFSGHKLFGPTGIGILYGKKALLEQMPPYQGGGDMISEVFAEYSTYNALPLKFEAGTPMITEVMGLAAAIDYIEQIGFESIQSHEKQLVGALVAGLQDMPRVQIIGNPTHRASLASFIIEGAHPLDVATMLDLKGIAIRTGHHCSQPVMRKFNVLSTCRASIAFYNTLEEIDCFLEGLKKTLELL